MMQNLLPHDLLQLTPDGVAELNELAHLSSIPLVSFPFVVVRRAAANGNMIPIGVRGRERWERYAGWVSRSHVAARIAPEVIATHATRPGVPAFAALYAMRRRLGGLRLTWGPIGSTGFELVSRAVVVRAGSDLDLMVRAPEPLADVTLQMLSHAAHDLPCAVDLQIETPHGAFTLSEYLDSPRQCLLRTIHGARLVASPWLPQQCTERVSM